MSTMMGCRTANEDRTWSVLAASAGPRPLMFANQSHWNEAAMGQSQVGLVDFNALPKSEKPPSIRVVPPPYAMTA
ncbi:MAG: hypothetical protein R3C56_08575 [Pirellulaceae bacterium]